MPLWVNFMYLKGKKTSTLRQYIVESLGYHVNITALIWNTVSKVQCFSGRLTKMYGKFS